jgi:hypothetical protein
MTINCIAVFAGPARTAIGTLGEATRTMALAIHEEDAVDN